jgi:transposase
VAALAAGWTSWTRVREQREAASRERNRGAGACEEEAAAGSGLGISAGRHDPYRTSWTGVGPPGRQRGCCDGASYPEESAPVIGLPAGTRIWIAAGVTDMRCGFHGLSAQVQTVLEQQPLSGHVFVFHGRRGDIVKVLWFDRDGLCLLAKRLERGRFVWPQASSGTVSLSRAQLSMLLESIDWRAPLRAAEPVISV